LKRKHRRNRIAVQLSSARYSAQPFTAGLEIDDITFDTGLLFPKTVEVRGDAEHRQDRQI
jgi:hypothetical protein